MDLEKLDEALSFSLSTDLRIYHQLLASALGTMHFGVFTANFASPGPLKEQVAQKDSGGPFSADSSKFYYFWEIWGFLAAIGGEILETREFA